MQNLRGMRKIIKKFFDFDYRAIILLGIMFLLIPKVVIHHDSENGRYLLVDQLDVANIVDEHYHDYHVVGSILPQWNKVLSYSDGVNITDDGRMFNGSESFSFYALPKRDVLLVKRAEIFCNERSIKYTIGNYSGLWDHGDQKDCFRSWRDVTIIFPSYLIDSENSMITFEPDSEKIYANSYHYWIYSKLTPLEYLGYSILIGLRYLLVILLVLLVSHKILRSRESILAYLRENFIPIMIWVSVFLLVFFTYYWIISLGTWDIGASDKWRKLDGLSAHGTLADGFLKGQLNILLEPSQEILDITNPYDPSQIERLYFVPGKYDVFDFLYFKGKYYLFHTPVPTLIFHLPSHIIFREDVLDSTVISAFMLGTYVFLSLSILHVQRTYFPDTSSIVLICAYLALGFGNFAFILFSRPAMYEVSISCGVFFITGAMYWLLTLSSENFSKNNLRYFLSGLFLGLSVWSRPTYSLAAILAIGATTVYILVIGYKFKGTTKRISYLLLPFIFISLVFLSYNYLRFDDPTEFGIRYQLTPINPENLFRISFSNIIKWLYFHFFRIPTFSDIAPFIHPSESVSSYISLSSKQSYYIESTLPLHIITPYVLILVPLILVIILWLIRGANIFIRKPSSLGKWIIEMEPEKFHLMFVFSLLTLTLLGTILLFSLIPSVCQRYITDYASLMILLSAISWISVIESIKKSRRFKIFTYIVLGIMILLTVITMLTNFLMFFNYLSASNARNLLFLVTDILHLG